MEKIFGGLDFVEAGEQDLKTSEVENKALNADKSPEEAVHVEETKSVIS
jgi:hypothetical protein